MERCFWHGCPKHGHYPKTNAKFWRDKIARNRAQDAEVNRALRKLGWKVIRVWEHELRCRDEAKLIQRFETVLATKSAMGHKK